MIRFPYEAVAWDIDGTLVDSEPLHHRALIATCAEYRLDISEFDETTFVGVHMHDVFVRLSREFRTAPAEEEFQARISHHYRAGAHKLRPIPGSVQTVHALAEMGVVQVCASNSGREVVDANLSAIGVTDLMRATVSLDDVLRGKPSPDSYLRAAELAGCAPDRVLAVEDSLTGLRAARAAGMAVACLYPGALPQAAVYEGLFDFGLNSLDEIPTLRGALRVLRPM